MTLPTKAEVLAAIAENERLQKLRKAGRVLHVEHRESIATRRLNGTAMEFPIVARKNDSP